jgi:hypothetical protein
MRELLTIADKVEDLSREIPVSSFSGFLEDTNRKIRKIAAKNYFLIDVFKSINASSETKKLAKYLQESNSDADFRLYLKMKIATILKFLKNCLPLLLLFM